MTINFSATRNDKMLLLKITDRAASLYKALGTSIDQRTIIMDITACHLNGNPLRLRDLLQASNFDFAHDVIGISSTIDRRTGGLTKGFIPRFSKPVRTSKAEAL